MLVGVLNEIAMRSPSRSRNRDAQKTTEAWRARVRIQKRAWSVVDRNGAQGLPPKRRTSRLGGEEAKLGAGSVSPIRRAVDVRINAATAFRSRGHSGGKGRYDRWAFLRRGRVHHSSRFAGCSWGRHVRAGRSVELGPTSRSRSHGKMSRRGKEKSLAGALGRRVVTKQSDRERATIWSGCRHPLHEHHA